MLRSLFPDVCAHATGVTGVTGVNGNVRVPEQVLIILKKNKNKDLVCFIDA